MINRLPVVLERRREGVRFRGDVRRGFRHPVRQLGVGGRRAVDEHRETERQREPEHDVARQANHVV